MFRRVKSITDVVEMQLCSGCGACAFAEAGRFTMVDVPSFGRRPILIPDAAAESGAGMAVCPGHQLTKPRHGADRYWRESDTGSTNCLGPVDSVFEAYAVDEDIRYSASSGGIATALALYCLEKGGYSGVLQTAQNADRPYLNETVLSVERKDVLAAMGSKYSPSSPCEGLGHIEGGDGQYVMVGKPCDISAASKSKRVFPGLDQRLLLTISIFCAGTPSTEGNIDLMRRAGISDPNDVSEYRFRGNGWPGRWYVKSKDGNGVLERSLSYEQSWGHIQSFRQWRCLICPDHMGEFADISLGDPWYLDKNKDQKGKSIVVARSEKGRDLIHEAVNTGYIKAAPVSANLLYECKPDPKVNLGMLWGKLATLRGMGAAYPTYDGYSLFHYWAAELSAWKKVQSIFGTAKRVFRRRLYRRVRAKKSS